MGCISLEGLEKSLNEGCYIRVSSFTTYSTPYSKVSVEKKDLETWAIKLIATAENENILLTLYGASKKIIDETENILDDENLGKRTLIDKNLEQGYELLFFKLANGKVLTTICDSGFGNFIPIKSIMSDDIITGFDTLNATCPPFEFDRTFGAYGFVEEQTTPVKEYQKKLI